MSLWASWLPRDSQARMDCIGRCCHKQTGSHNLTEVEDKPLGVERDSRYLCLVLGVEIQGPGQYKQRLRGWSLVNR